MADERRIIELIIKQTGDAEIKRMARDLGQLKDAAQKTQTQLESMSAGMSKFASTIKNSVIGAAVISGLERFAGAAVDAAAEMDELSVTISKVGVSAKDFQGLQFGAALSNVDADALNKGLVKLSVNMADIANKGSPATKTLRELGITATSGTLPAMEKLADKFAAMQDGAAKTALAVQIFGKAGAELIPLLNEGASGIAAMSKEAKELAGVFSGEELQAVNQLHDQMDRLKTLSEGLTKHFIAGLAPALSAMAGDLINAAKHTKNLGDQFFILGERVGRAITDIREWLANLDQVEVIVNKFSDGLVAVGTATRQFLAGNYTEAGEQARKAKKDFEDMGKAIGGYKKAVSDAQVGIETGYQNERLDARRKGLILAHPPPGEGIGDLGGGGGSAAKEKAEKGLDLTKASAQFQEDLSKMTAGFAATDKAANDMAETIRRAANPAIAYSEGMQKVADALRDHKINADDARVAEEALTKTMNDSQKALDENSAASQKAAKAHEEAAEKLAAFQEKWGFVGEAMSQAIGDIITGAAKVGQAIKTMVATILQEVAKLLATKLATMVVKSLLGTTAGADGAKWAKGGAFAAGGVVNQPTRFAYGGGIGIMGEAGPEAIMPLKRNAAGQLGVMGGAGGVNVVVNNNAPSAAIGVRQTGGDIQIDVIERQLAERIRRGGSALPGAIETTYRSGRGAGAFA